MQPSTGPTAYTRRNVLQLLASGVAGSALLPSLARAADRADVRESEGEGEGEGESAPRVDRIGLQLYTVRSALAKDLEGTIAAVAAAGITELEFAGYYNKSPEWWRELMTRHRLSAPSTHEALPKTDEGWSAIMDRAAAMGHSLVVVPFVGADYRGSRDNWLRLVDRLNIGGEHAKKSGLQFGYHNHDFEFAPVGTDTGFNIIMQQSDAALVKIELDIYWAVKAGHDPLKIIRDWPKRVVACHVKDAGPAPERQMRDVGAGTIDFKTLLDEGRKQGLAHWFIEHDQPTDPLASIRASAAAMKKL